MEKEDMNLIIYSSTKEKFHGHYRFEIANDDYWKKLIYISDRYRQIYFKIIRI
jgi:hypothetical protein